MSGSDCGCLNCVFHLFIFKATHAAVFPHFPNFFWQFYNSLCRNLPRRYVLPLDVDEQTPLDQNLIKLENCKATAKKTKPGEVGLCSENPHCICRVICLNVRNQTYNHDKYSQFSPTHSAQLPGIMR